MKIVPPSLFASAAIWVGVLKDSIRAMRKRQAAAAQGCGKSVTQSPVHVRDYLIVELRVPRPRPTVFIGKRMSGWAVVVLEHGEAVQGEVPHRKMFQANWSEAIRTAGRASRQNVVPNHVVFCAIKPRAGTTNLVGQIGIEALPAKQPSQPIWLSGVVCHAFATSSSDARTRWDNGCVRDDGRLFRSLKAHILFQSCPFDQAQVACTARTSDRSSRARQELESPQIPATAVAESIVWVSPWMKMLPTP